MMTAAGQGVTQDAIAVIEDLAARKVSWRRLDEHITALPQSAGALARVLARPEFRASVATYETNSKAASTAQDVHKYYARIGCITGFLIAAVAATRLYAGTAAGQPVGQALSGVQAALLVVMVWAIANLRWRKPHEEWGRARARSERLRIEHFRQLLLADEPARPGEIPTLPLLLEYVRLYLMADQRSWFDGKAATFGWHRWREGLWYWVAAIMTAGATVAWVASFVDDWARVALPKIAPVVSMLAVPDHATFLTLVSVVGGALYGLVLNLSTLSLVDRNANAYRAMTKVLDDLAGAQLTKARAAAAAGDRAGLDGFWQELAFQLFAEQREWNAVLGNAQSMLLGQLTRLSKP